MGAEMCIGGGSGDEWGEWGDGGEWDEWGEWGDGGGRGAVCRRGLRRGAVSRPFRAADLLRALRPPAPPDTRTARPVYVDVDSAGYLVAGGAGGTGGAGGAAALCVRAALAPNVHARSALLTALDVAPPSWPPSAETLLQLRLEADRAPHAALSVWLDERLRAALGVPHLDLHHIRGEKEYACHLCGARFPEPNPLKAHLFLQCANPAPRRFWRRVAARLAPPAPLAPPADPARLEALAAEWGRGGRGGAHACVYCGKLYSRKYGLKIHIRTHTGYRPLRCGLCARAFGDPSNLNKHVRLHAARGGRGGRDLERRLRTHAAPP